jgi:hypothetical protein
MVASFVPGGKIATKGVKVLAALGKASPKVASAVKVGKALCSSFVAGTLVLMADGSRKPIDEIVVGDKVLATDPLTGETAAKDVTDLIVSTGIKDLIEITVTSGSAGGEHDSTLTATAEHPFWVSASKQWINAADLAPGMWLRASTGTYAQVGAVKRWTAVQRVHNMTVGRLHTYYVLGGTTPVLVHNSGECIPMSSAIGRDSFLTKAARQAGKNQAAQRDLDALFEQLSRGNMNPGIQTKSLSGTDVSYARGRNGGRLFFRNVNGGIQIVGKADKGNESSVIARLKNLYG